MKKTISIHLMGVNCLVEETAYELIEQYLKRLKDSFQHSSDQKEICEDVELRIAELASEKVTDKKHVVTFSEMKEILDTLGDPEDFEGSANPSDKKQDQSDFKAKRRLYRDTENKTIAGVCSGLAAYFDIDVVYVRIAFAIFFFIGGFIIPVYAVLWIAVPEAKTNADRLKMHGRPVNIETLKEELRDATDSFKKSAKGFESAVKNGKNQAVQSINQIGKVFSKIFALFFWVIGGIGLVSVILIAFGNVIQFNEHTMITTSEFTNFFLIDATNSFYFWIAFVLLSFSILISFILTGTVLFFNLRSVWIKRTYVLLTLLGITGISLGIYQSLRLANDFRTEGKTVQNVGVVSDTILFLNVVKQPISYQEDQNMIIWNDSQIELKNKRVIAAGMEVEYGISPDSNFYISQTFSARGKSTRAGFQKASHIFLDTKISGNKVQIPANYEYPLNDKFRNQSVSIKILIPYGRKVITDNTVIQSNDKLQTGWINEEGNYENN